ncbi:hypothetical protein H4217_009008 [Coemansia sp. RSA 1939]|nr:hypothetical protein H4217_009008 [Coemansia sp. RSA 1939]
MSFGQLRPIVGGEPVGSAHEYPFAVRLSIETRPGWHAVCGGSLLSAQHIVTAAHCVHRAQAPDAVRIGFGHAYSARQRTTRAVAVRVHPAFDSHTLANDIAVVEVGAHAIGETRQAHRVPVYFGPVRGGLRLTAMGWGVTSNAPDAHTSSVLNAVALAVASPQACRSVDGAFRSSDGPFVCTATGGGLRDECSGDSGAPAVVADESAKAGARRGARPQRVRLVALTSFGDNTVHDSHPPCADPSGFGFSTHVAYFHDFITNATGLTRRQLEEPVQFDRLVSIENLRQPKVTEAVELVTLDMSSFPDGGARHSLAARGLRMGPSPGELGVQSVLLAALILVLVSRQYICL